MPRLPSLLAAQLFLLLAAVGWSQPRAPQLLSLERLSPSTIAAGDMLQYSYEVDPRGNELSMVSVRLEEPAGDVFLVTAWGPNVKGIMQLETPRDIPGAVYQVVHVEVQTLEGRRTRYERNGAVVTSPASLAAPPALPLPLAAADVTVINPIPRAAPELRSIRRTSPAQVSLGDTLSFEVELDQSTAEPVSIRIFASADTRSPVLMLQGEAIGPLINVSAPIEDHYFPLGYAVYQVEITYRRVTAYYSREPSVAGGSVSYRPARFAPTSLHDIDFRPLVFAVTGTTGPAAPVIKSAQRIGPAVVAPGTTVAFDMEIEGAPSAIDDIVFIFDGSDGTTISAVPDSPWRHFTRRTTPGMSGVSYQLSLVIINARSGAMTMYRPNSIFAVPSTHPLETWNLSALSFSVAATSPPHISTSPTDVTVLVGAAAEFGVRAEGADLTYQWRKDGVPIPGATAATYRIASVVADDAGNYSVEITNSVASVISAGAVLAVSPTPAPPLITQEPANASTAAGAPIAFSIEAVGLAPLSYQWSYNGVPIAGANATVLSLSSVTLADAGTYRVTVSNVWGHVTSRSAELTVESTRSRITNMSVRTPFAAKQVLILGLTTRGPAVEVIARAAGPGLLPFDLPDLMENPRLAVYAGQQKVAENDDWEGSLSGYFQSVGAFPFLNGSRDAAVRQSVDGAVTLHLSGEDAGMVLGEVYARPVSAESRLINVSARNHVGTDHRVLIGGFTITGTGPLTVLVRAIGPGLQRHEVPNGLQDPGLELYHGQTKLAENDDWNPEHSPVMSRAGAFALEPNSKDSVLVAALAPGSYTAIVSGADGGTGEALLEIYEVP